MGTIRQPYDEGIIVLRCLTLGKVLRPQKASGDIAPSKRVTLLHMHDMNAALMGNRENPLIGSAPDIPAHPEFPHPKIFQNCREAPEMILVRMRERDDFNLFQAARPQVW